MRLELPDPAVVHALAGQQQVHAERPAQPPDHHEQVHEVAVRGEQLAELVDDDEEGGQRIQRRALRASPLVVEDGAEPARLAEQFLPADQLAVNGGLHAADQGSLVGQVGDDGRGVRQLVEAQEGRAALEVDQDEVQGFRRVCRRQREDQGPQQFALARAGGADEHAVRPHPAQRRLLDVQLDRVAVGVDADRHPQPLAGPAGGPQLAQVEASQVGDLQHGAEVEVGLEIVLGGLGHDAEPVRGEQPGDHRGARGADSVRLGQPGPLLVAEPVPAHHEQVVALGVQAQRALGGGRRGIVEVDENGVAVTGGRHPATVAHPAAIADHQHERFVPARRRALLVPRACR